MTTKEILQGIRDWVANKIQGINATDVLGENYYVDEDGIYIKKSDGNVYPISHPDLSTQPSILPQRFGVFQLKEVLVPNLTKEADFVADAEIVPSNVTIIDVSLFNDLECIGGYTKKENGVIKIYNKEGFVADYALIRYYVAHGDDYYEIYGGEDEDEKEIIVHPARYLTFIGGENNSSIGLNSIAYGHNVYYSTDLEHWKLFNTHKDIPLNEGSSVYVIGDAYSAIFTESITVFRMNGKIAASGDITSILDYMTLDDKIYPYCYQSMFYGCTSLTQAPTLPATTLAPYCYQSMFYGCTSLTQAPTLPATTLAPSCYQSMFYGCTSLTQAPTLPATTLAPSCYQSMFYGCTSLTQAPTLPATTLAPSCYQFMFYGCTSLTQAPTLPATTLAPYCYQSMFYGCKKLTSIVCLATNISASGSTYNWVHGVYSSGTFTKEELMTSWTSGENGIPNGWTVVDYVEQ